MNNKNKNFAIVVSRTNPFLNYGRSVYVKKSLWFGLVDVSEIGNDSPVYKLNVNELLFCDKTYSYPDYHCSIDKANLIDTRRK